MDCTCDVVKKTRKNKIVFLVVSVQELDLDAEVRELLRQIPEKRKMRMYADDEEELRKRSVT